MNKLKKINWVICAVLLTASACKNNETSEKVENAVDSITTKVENAVDTAKAKYDENKESNFVKDVIHSNTQELHLLALAKQKGVNKEVKSHAKMMETDHKKLGEKMNTYATAKGITVDIDSSDMKSSMDDDKAGADWDKTWADKMVDDHEKTIKKFEDAQNDVKDEELKTIITNTLPTLHSHLDMAKELQAKLKK